MSSDATGARFDGVLARGVTSFTVFTALFVFAAIGARPCDAAEPVTSGSASTASSASSASSESIESKGAERRDGLVETNRFPALPCSRLNLLTGDFASGDPNQSRPQVLERRWQNPPNDSLEYKLEPGAGGRNAIAAELGDQ